jgi:outer membrane protein assembly factor BamB
MNKFKYATRSLFVLFLLISIIITEAVIAAEWPQWRGPKQDAVCTETGLLKSWPQGGPELLWEVTGLGAGYSTVSISNGKLFTMGDLKVDNQDAQCVIAVDMETHKKLWTTKIGPIHKDERGGPRCTPTIDDGLVYVIGTSGDLVCLNADKGEIIWNKNLVKEFDGKSPNWKYCESPLVDGDKVLCSSGNSKAIIIAFNKKTGDVIWKCAMPDIGDIGKEDAGYSSIVISNGGGMKQYLKMVGKGLISVSADGKFLWGYNKIANRAATIPVPIADGDYVFCASGYDTGAALLKLSPDNGTVKMEEVYFLEGRKFQSHHGCMVKVGDYIYGGHGQNQGKPTCIEMKTGKIMWQENQPGEGSAGVLYADGNIYFRYENNLMVLVEANPEKFIIKSTFTPPKRPGATGQAWAHPVIVDGRLYLRYADILMVYNVKAK